MEQALAAQLFNNICVCCCDEKSIFCPVKCDHRMYILLRRKNTCCTNEFISLLELKLYIMSDYTGIRVKDLNIGDRLPWRPIYSAYKKLSKYSDHICLLRDICPLFLNHRYITIYGTENPRIVLCKESFEKGVTTMNMLNNLYDLDTRLVKIETHVDRLSFVGRKIVRFDKVL